MTIFTPYGFPDAGPDYLSATEFLDTGHPDVVAFTQNAVGDATAEREKAIRLYYAVRDRIRYDPFLIRLDRDFYRASDVIRRGSGYCINKAVLLAACARVAGIPSALGFADVVNHLNSPKLKERMGGREVFLHHGYAVLSIDGRWVKAAPAFNIELCERFRVLPTEFDGQSDAVLQEFDADSRKHMEYLRHHGIWSDLPFNRIADEFRGYYPPGLFTEGQADAEFAA